MSTRWEQIG